MTSTKTLIPVLILTAFATNVIQVAGEHTIHLANILASTCGVQYFRQGVYVIVVVTPLYGSMEGYLVYCALVILFVCHFVCTVTDFSAAEKARGVKFCMRVGLLSRQVFSPLVNFGSRGVMGAAA